MENQIEQGFRLSPQQRRLWWLQRGEEGSSYRSRCVLRIEGELDRPAFARALEATVARNEILRTAFSLLPGMSIPLQVIGEPGPPAFEEADLSGLAPEQRDARLHDLFARPVTAGDGGPLRAALARLGEREHALVLDLPALCADPATLENLTTEVLRAYAGEENAEPPMQFADLAEWQNQLLESEDSAEGVNRWRQVWRDLDLSVHLTGRLPFENGASGTGSFAPGSVPVPVAPETARTLAELAAAWEARPEDLLLAGWQVFLWQSTGRAETLVGLLHHGRGYEELRSALGPFARYLPVHVRLDADRTFRKAVHLAREASEDAGLRQEHFSWEQAAGWNGDPSSPAFFPAGFEAEPEPWERSAAGLRVRLDRQESRSERFKLALSCAWRGGEPALALRYDQSLFSRAAVELLAERLAAVLQVLAERPETPVGEIDLLGARELGRIRELGPGPEVAAERIESCIHQRFEEQTLRTPGRPAVAWGDQELTFRELNERANRLAHHLIALGAGPEVLVAFCLERSLDAVAAVLGVLKTGGAYVPLDPSHPAERLSFILEDTGAPLLLTESRLAGFLPVDRPGLRTVLLDAEEETLAALPAANPEAGAGPRNLAYAIYTSGSTGHPKGVLIEHRSALNLLAGLEDAVFARHTGRAAPMRVSQNAPLIFDASMQQIVQLLAGHTLDVVPEEVRADGAALLAFLRERRLDLFDCTPSQLRILLAAGLLDGGPAPEVVLTAGEAVDDAMWDALLRAERTAFYNIYGPTECTVDATSHLVGSARGGSNRGPTIGRPLPGYEVYLLGPDLRPVPIGAPGELCVAGASLARGYVRRPDTTAERFAPHPFGRPGERIYRTGDLARHRPDGDLEFLGRIDHQVKIRGYRIEPGEIESALALHPWVAEAAVVPWQKSGDSPILAAYVALGPSAPSGLGGVAAELQGFLRERLPPYMVPAAFTVLPAFPRTPSGKVDRRSLPAPDLSRSGLGTEYAPPRNAVEELLAAIWEEVLEIERVGIHDSFFDLGGHSLLATQVISRVRDALHLELPVRRLFESPTVAELAEAAEAARAAGSAAQAPPILPVPRDRELPLSFAQQRLWFLQQLEPGSTAYNTPFALRLRGPADAAALEWTFEQVIQRHETLRTTFTLSGGQPVQTIAPPGPVPLPVVDLASLPPPARGVEALRLAAEEAKTPFDLSRLPVVRHRLLRLSPQEHVLLFTIHHVSGDGWSMEVLTREIVELYNARAEGRVPSLPDLPVQYADFAVWQREWLQGEALDAQIAYWRNQLAGAPALLELPTDRPRPPMQTERSGRVSLDLSPALSGAAEELGKKEGATPFMTLLAAYTVLLHRLTSQGTIVVGTPMAGRNRREIEGLIGFFANNLALRTDLEDEPSFRTLLRRVRETSLGAYAHEDLPFDKLVDELQPPRDMSHAPIFQVMFVYQAEIRQGLDLAGLELRPFGGGGAAARYDLTLTCAEQEGFFACGLDFNADLFEEATARRILSLFAHLIESAVAQPDRPVSELPLLGEEERRQVLFQWNDTQRDFPEACLHELFEAQAARNPEAVALLFEGQSITYGELRGQAERLARHLRRLGVGPESRVGLCCERSPEALASMLGVLMAGGAYVPLDPEAPRERLEAIAADAGISVLLTQASIEQSVEGIAQTLIRVDINEDVPEAGTEAPALPVLPDNAAYMIYTSGSTGVAKGVVATHRNAANFVRALGGAVGLGPEDRLFLFAPLSFDASVLQIFLPLTSGGGLAVHRHPRQLAAHEILALCERCGVTVLDLPAALWRQWVEEVADRGLHVPSRIRTFLTGGESVPVAKLRSWAGLTDRPAGFLSSYGPTEATVTSTAFVTTSDRADTIGRPNVPIGRPLANVRCYVLDDALQPVPPGVPGELYLAGAGLTRGYLGRPGLTAEAFRPAALDGEEPGARLYRTGDLARWLPDGNLEFLGRADHQVKVRGFRIEIGEIETALAAHPAVRQCVAAVREDVPGDRRLAAYLVPEGAAPGPDELRIFLARRLPDYMIPSSFTAMERLPVLPTGKVDRAALPAPTQAEVAATARPYAPPRNAVEEVLAGLWADVLRLERVGIDDHFFEMGGHSLLAAQVIGRVRDTLETEVELRLLFEAPTVAGFAEALLRDPDQRARVEQIAEVTLAVARLADDEVEAMLGEDAVASGDIG
ncbi:MAG TPA: amino acid adenylation domain-containing protein [Thermoanaerobaculia bacterium]